MHQCLVKTIFQTEIGWDRLDLCLLDRFPDQSRSMLQRLIREGNVLLRGGTADPKSPVRVGDSIEVTFPASTPAIPQPEDIPLEILFEDKHLLVLNKAPHFVVHAGAGNMEHTLVNALLHHCRGQLSGIGGVERPGIVHRLDKDTSGCLVVAKTDVTHRRLVEQFQSRSIEKRYLALVWGVPRMPSGKIDKPIGRHRIHRSKMAIDEKGRPALTDWKVLGRGDGFSLLECHLHTGRTHQIRVHLASIQHPLLGDLTYGRPHTSPLKIPRQMLHAWKLSFQHPVTEKTIACAAPIPEDMGALIRFTSSPQGTTLAGLLKEPS